MNHVTETWTPQAAWRLPGVNLHRRCCSAFAAMAGLALALLLAGCGQKGPLFIPDTAPAAQRATLPQTLLRQSSNAASPNARDDTQQPTATPSSAAQPPTP